MKTSFPRRALPTLTLACAIAFSAEFAGAQVTAAQLKANPLWLPATTSILKDLAFTDGNRAQAGVAYPLVAIEGNDVTLRLPSGTIFSVPIKDSTLLKDADAHLAAFTPRQRELTPRTLAADESLWPYQVTLTTTVAFDGGVQFNRGDQIKLVKFDGKSIQVHEPKSHTLYTLDATMTDFYARGLQNALTPQPSRLYQEIAENVIDGTTLGPVDFLADGGPDYIAVYYAADWCPYCKTTSPEVLKWYEQNMAREKRQIELILVSNDKSQAEMERHLKAMNFRSPVVPFHRLNAAVLLHGSSKTRRLPMLFVVDRGGKVVLESINAQPMDRTQDMLRRIAQLQARLDADDPK